MSCQEGEITPRSSVHLCSGLRVVVGAVAILAIGAPAFGQGSASGFTVIGSSDLTAGRVSSPVSYRDLDLTTGDGRAALHGRVRRSAEDLCRRIGEDHLGHGAATPSCEDGAVLSAATQERDVIARASARTFAGSAPPTSFVMTMNTAGSR
jgi:UrcA family protein